MRNLKQTLLFLILFLTSALAEAQTGKLYNTENGLSSKLCQSGVSRQPWLHLGGYA